jgi:hypothetical protein
MPAPSSVSSVFSVSHSLPLVLRIPTQLLRTFALKREDERIKNPAAHLRKRRGRNREEAEYQTNQYESMNPLLQATS